MVSTPFRLMNPALLDPNNHVPEVSPDDGWGDVEGLSPAPTAGRATVLPPRRAVADRTPGAALIGEEGGQTGLRIGSHFVSEILSDLPQRLEVQEFSRSVVRLEQTAPARFPRQLTFHERPSRESSGKESPDESLQWGVSRRRPTYWLIGAGVAVAVIVVLAMMLLPAINAPNAARPLPDAPTFVEEKLEGVEAMNLLLGKQAEAMRIFRSYATATRVDEILPLLGDGSALEKTLRANWRPLKISNAWDPSAASTWEVLTSTEHPCGLLQGTLPDQSNFSAYFTNDGNHLLLDWKATAAIGTATFEQLTSGQGDPGEIRGKISYSDYYSGVFPEADYQSYRLVSPDGESSVWCYARRGESADEAIAPIAEREQIGGELQRSSRITLRLERGPTAALPNQWLIGEMLHLDWVTP